jgi:DNA-binding MarR family transcriptional regulator
LENQQRDQLFEVLNKLRKTKHTMPTFDGLPQGEFIMMHMISHSMHDQNDNGDDSGIKASDLSSRLHMSKPAVSQMLNSLEDKGFVERKVKKNDRRVVLISLTESGNRLMEENHQKLIALVDVIIEKFGETDMKTLISLLNKLSTILESMKCNCNNSK